MRIAQVTNLYEAVPPIDQHGLERVVYDLTEELVKMGHEVTLFATADSKTSAKLVPMWPKAVRKDEYGKILDGATYSMWSVSEAFIRQNDFDVIHDHTRFVAAHFAGIIKSPVVTTIHHPISQELDFPKQYPLEYQEYFKRITERNLSFINPVVVSDFQAKIFSQGYGKTPTVIHNGLPLELWQYSDQPEDYFAFLGYITPDKGAAEAIQAVIPTGKKLKIAGPLDNREVNQKYFNERIKPYLNDKIEYVGSLNFNEKTDFLRKAKALLMPIQWDEPFGLVAIESMVCGTPVIAWNRAAMPEIIRDGVDGYLVNSVEEMTAKLEEVSKLDRMVCRKRIEDNFSAKTMAENYVKIYESVNNKN